MKSRTSHTIVFALLGVAVLVVCFNAWLAYRSVDALWESERWVTRTWLAINSLETVSDSLKDAESGNRGYLLTGDAAYLTPFTQAQQRLPGELTTVAQFITDNPAEQNDLSELRAVIESRMSLLEQSIEERRAGHVDSVHQQVLSGTGLAEMNHGRSLVAKMQQAEQGLLTERVAASHRDVGRALATVLFASIVDLLLIILMFRHVTDERRLRQRADQTSERLGKLQSISDVALTHLAVEDLTAELLSRAQRVISADVVFLCVQHKGSLIVEASAGAPIAPGTAIPLAEAGPLEQALDQRRPLMVADTASHPLPLQTLQQNTGSLLVAPLSVSRSVTGILAAGRRAVQPFDRHDEELLSLVAGRIAVALDRANAYKAERQARRDAEFRAEEVRLLNAELEERVAQRTADLEAINRELESFSYSVSHDLRAPLRTIDGFSVALEEDYRPALDANGRDYLRRIRDGVQRMGQLIDSLLQLSRITRAELVHEPVNLTALARTVADELAAQNPDRTIAFEIQSGLNCMGDPRLLRAAFENLLGNAVKFTAKAPQATVRVGRSGESYFVRDSGAGFDMRYADKLFNAFARLHGDREFRGSGIGLATVARIVRRHQGRIWAESEVGRGATFWFTLG